MAVIKETDSQLKDGKNYESIEHEGRKAVLQKVVGGIRDADDECKELKEDELKLSVIVRTSGGKIVTDAVIPEALHNQVPEIIA